MVAKKTKTAKKNINTDKVKKAFDNVKSNVKKNVKIDKETIDESKSIFMNLINAMRLQVISGKLVDMIMGIKGILLTPGKFFSSIKEDGNYTQAIATIICFGLIGGIAKIILSIGSITLVDALTAIIFQPVLLFVLSFALAGILLMFSFLARGEISFEKAYKIVASQAFLYPIFIIGFKVSFFWVMLTLVSFIADMYIMLLAYISCVYGLKAKENLAQLVFGIALVLLILFYFFSSYSNFWIGYRNPNIGIEYFIDIK